MCGSIQSYCPVLQALAMAKPEMLVSSSRDWVPLFIAYVAAKSSSADDGNREDQEGLKASEEATLDEKKTVSLVSAIGGRYILIRLCNFY